MFKEAFQDNPTTPYVEVQGWVTDAPYHERWVETELEAPEDATPGCAVFSVVNPDCSSLNGCGAGSTVASCDEAASTGVNPCLCIANDTCEHTPSQLDVGDVTLDGVADTTGDKSWQLANVENTYHPPEGMTLAPPGEAFAEGDAIALSATGGDYEAFDIAAQGVSPLVLTNNDIYLAKDTSTTDPTQWLALDVGWEPPESPDVSRISLELNISRHAGTVGLLICDLEDTGSATLSGSLISQLAALGNIAGFPELQITRYNTGSVETKDGNIELIVGAFVERFPTMEGYTSCLLDRECPTGQICNTQNKLCRDP